MSDQQIEESGVDHSAMANALRFLAIDAVGQAQSGHPGLAMGMADVATVLFRRFLKCDPRHPEADRQAGIETTTGPLGQGIANAVGTALVSMPCMSLFDRQSEDYRQAVLGAGTLPVAVEAAVRFGWDRYLGADGLFIGMDGFGASGPAEELYRHFGITSQAVVAAVAAKMRRPTH
jgi:transketolase